jgi:hypothetical protein
LDIRPLSGQLLSVASAGDCREDPRGLCTEHLFRGKREKILGRVSHATVGEEGVVTWELADRRDEVRGLIVASLMIIERLKLFSITPRRNTCNQVLLTES